MKLLKVHLNRHPVQLNLHMKLFKCPNIYFEMVYVLTFTLTFLAFVDQRNSDFGKLSSTVRFLTRQGRLVGNIPSMCQLPPF